MNAHAQLGHNNPPADDPIDAAIAPYADAIEEAGNWTDGTPVENEAQMKAVDAILKQIRSAGTALSKAEKEALAPLTAAHKAEKDRWRPTIADIADIKAALTSIVSDFKAQLAAKREAERKAAEEQALRLADEAATKVAAANAGNLDEAREARAAQEDAAAAMKVAKSVAKKTVPGMRAVTEYDILDVRALVNWIATNDKAAMAEFATEYARKNHAAIPNGIVNTYTTKKAY